MRLWLCDMLADFIELGRTRLYSSLGRGREIFDPSDASKYAQWLGVHILTAVLHISADLCAREPLGLGA